MQFSVIIPVRNRFDLLRRALDSVIRQEGVGSVEIIIVDDASENNIKESLQHFDGCHLKVLRNDERMNAAYSRNLGVSKSSGRYIAFLDSDDYWLPDHLANALEHLQAQPDVLYIARSADENARSRSISFDGRVEDPYRLLFSQGGDYRTSCFVCVRENFEEVGGFDAELEKHQDWDLALRYSLKRPLYYSRHVSVVLDGGAPGRMSHSPNLLASERFLRTHRDQMDENMLNTFLLGVYKGCILRDAVSVERAKAFVHQFTTSPVVSTDIKSSLMWRLPQVYRLTHKAYRFLNSVRH